MRHGIVVKFAVIALCLLMGEGLLGDQTEPAKETSVAAEQPTMLAGADASPLDTTGLSMTETILPSITRIGFSLIIIIGVIYASVFILRKLSGRRLGGRGVKTIQVVEQAFLAPKKSICLLKLADRAVLVGITENNINLLTEMPWDELPEDYTRNANSKSGSFQGFLNGAASKFLGQKKSKGTDNEPMV